SRVGVTSTLTISSTSLDLGTTQAGTAGTANSYTARRCYDPAPITITAPTGVEVSSDNGASYKTTVTLTPTGGAVASTTINVRIASSAVQGVISGIITIFSAGATQQDVPVTGNIVNSVDPNDLVGPAGFGDAKFVVP